MIKSKKNFFILLIAAGAGLWLAFAVTNWIKETSVVINDLYLPDMYGDEYADGPQEVLYISIHCSVSNSKHPLTGKDILRIAKERGFKRNPYHFFIRRDKITDTLTPLNGNKVLEDKELCWTVAGYNSKTIGVCIDGCYIDYPLWRQDNRTPYQDKELERIVAGLKLQFPKAKVLGHNEFPGVTKVCPGFKASKLYGL